MHRNAEFAAFGGRMGARCHPGGYDLADLVRLMTGGRGPEGPGGHGGGRGERHGGHRHGPGRGGSGRGGFPFGPGGPWGGGPWGGGRRGRARRGDIRTAALLLLAEEPRNGYGIMQALEERSNGAWRPSPGSVYPALQQLEDEGLIRSAEHEGRRHYELTEDGRRVVAERGEDRPAPWEEMAGGVPQDAWALVEVGREVGMAMMQVMQTGSPAQRAEAQRILANARRDLYRLLADGDPERDAPADAADDEPA